MTEAAAGAGAAAGAAAGAGAGAAAPWYGDKIDTTTVGFWQNKGIDANDPVAVATKLTEFYRNSEKFVGAPPEEMLRMPKANAPEAEINAYWNKIGVPAEAKDYDLSTVKRADGKELPNGFADAFRAAAHSSRVPKEQAAGLMTALVKNMESVDAAALAERSAIIKAQVEALDKNWGTNKTYNLAKAERALQDLGKAAGLSPEDTKEAWDALGTVGGIGAAAAMEMLRVIGTKMGEPTDLITGDKGGGDKVMSIDQAKARIDELKLDKGFYKRLVTDKEAAANREWQDLHKIAYPGRAA